MVMEWKLQNGRKSVFSGHSTHSLPNKHAKVQIFLVSLSFECFCSGLGLRLFLHLLLFIKLKLCILNKTPLQNKTNVVLVPYCFVLRARRLQYSVAN